MKYTLQAPNFTVSPYTGMTRKHWLELCHFYLEGIFQHVKSFEDPIVLPRHETEVTYPQPNSLPWRYAAERFEGLARSFLLGAPLLFHEPEAVIGGYSLKEYYKNQILQSVTPGTKSYLLSIEEILPQKAPGERAFQHTCECASLVIGLSMCREVLWETYTKEEKDRIAEYLSGFGHSETGHHNWRLFNMLILGFLDREGYPVDHGMIRDHAQAIVSYYAGNGWYRDGHLFDYYCPWAFHVYGPLWNQWYGYEKEPYLAEKIEEYSNQMVETFSRMFDEEAHVTMWGRSGVYRNAVSAPLAANFLLRHSKANPGLARRIASGAALQFVTREECFLQGIPCMGFYGPFEAMVQSYSCAASPLWIANAFVCLMLPKEHSFWTAKEENGIWEHMKAGETYSTVLDGPGIVLDNHKDTGITEFRCAKVFMHKEDSSLNAYMRTSFNSRFLWEKLDFQGVESMQYSLWEEGKEKSMIPNILMYAGVRDGILYRKEYFDFEYSFQNKASISLADFPVSGGIVRVDKVQIPDKPYRLTFGSYGIPDYGDVEIEEKICSMTGAKAFILKSQRGQVAFVSYAGFDDLCVKERQGVNPITKKSKLVYGISQRDNYYEYLPYIIISVTLTKKDTSRWSEEELFPVHSISYMDSQKCGGYGPVKLKMKDGRTMVVDYEGIEGRLMI